MRRILAGLATLCLIASACGSQTPTTNEPETAAARARREAAESKENADDQAMSGKGKKWGGWRYQGDRGECYYIVGRKCFKELAEACKAARCDNGCNTEGAGPAAVSCK